MRKATILLSALVSVALMSAAFAQSAVTELLPELATTTATSDTFEGATVIAVQVGLEPGARRVRYIFPVDSDEVTTRWAIRSERINGSEIVFYNLGREIFGSVALSQTKAGKVVATPQGDLTSVSVEAGDDGWQIITSAFIPQAGQATAQIIYYPVGTTNDALSEPMQFEMTPPTLPPED